MKTIQVSPRTKSVNALLKQARRSNIILRTSDGTEFILAEIDDFDREIELTRQNKKLMALLDARAKETKTVSAAEARIRLGLVSNGKNSRPTQLPSRRANTRRKPVPGRRSARDGRSDSTKHAASEA